MAKLKSTDKILAIDIGGSRIKGTILDVDGNMLIEYKKIETPEAGNPQHVILAIEELISDFESFDKVSVGFPGYVKNGIVHTAPNLSTPKWKGFELASVLAKKLKKPVRLVNDADMQGLGVVKGEGLEIVITLGTGFGSAYFMNGSLLPHLEIAHHPITKSKTYDDYIGESAFQEIGDKRWNNRLEKIIEILKTVFNYDHLFIGGGNSRKIEFVLDDNITTVTNRDGITGGAKLWLKEDDFCVTSFNP